MSRHKFNRQVSRICRNVKNLNSINQSKSLVGGKRITSATFVNDNLRHYQFVSVAYLPPSPRRELTRCDDDVSLLSRGDMPNNSRFNVHGRFAHCSLCPNDRVHAAGALDLDFKTTAAARSRATPGYAILPVSGQAKQIAVLCSRLIKLEEIAERERRGEPTRSLMEAIPGEGAVGTLDTRM
jgi:hypothetical protein